jgi:hypothetical protein
MIENFYWGSPAKLAIAGYLSIVFFGLWAFVFMRKLPGKLNKSKFPTLSGTDLAAYYL